MSPGDIIRNSEIVYTFPNIRTVCHRLADDAVPAVLDQNAGTMQNTFANECFLDELAAAVSADPLEFRLKYTDPADKAASIFGSPRETIELAEAAIASETHLRQYREGTRSELR